MKRRILAMALAAALALSLTACGGGNNSNSSASNPGGSSSSSSSQPDASTPDASTPDGSQPDASTPDGSTSGSAGGSASSAETLKPLPSVTLTLNRTNIELNKAGATFRLRFTADPDTDGIASFTSSDTKIATVAEDGTVKAVAPGKATITVEYDGAKATASVNCNWKEETKPTEPAPEPEKPAEPSPAPATSVDLQKFYTDMETKYEFPFMMLADADILSQYHANMAETAPKAYYAGLENVKLKQQIIYMCGMSPAPTGDFALVEVEDAKDVETVKAIFQAQIDYMVGDGENRGGAFYPMEAETWENYARIVSNGNYVMLIASENCDDIVNAFNALF